MSIMQTVIGLVQRVKRVARSRSLIAFSNRYVELEARAARLSQQLTASHAREREGVRLRAAQRDSVRSEVQTLMSEKAGLAELLTQVSASRSKLHNGLLEIVTITSAGKSPNGTTKKVARIAAEALA